MSGDRGLVFVVDDDDAVGTAMARVLRAFGFDAHHFNSAAAFLRHRTDDRPACVLLDVRMPDVNGLELQRRLDRRPGPDRGLPHRACRRQDLGGGDEGRRRRFPDQAGRGGAPALGREPAVERSAAAQAGDRERVGFLARLSRLTPRERQVGALVIQGLLNKQIAGELGTAEKTVKVHRARVMEKLKVGSVAELARLAERTHTLHVEPPANATPATADGGHAADATNGQLAAGSSPGYPAAGRSSLHTTAASAKRGRS